MFLLFAELCIKEELFKEYTEEGSSTTKPHGAAEAMDYYLPNTLFIVEISHKHFKTIKHTMTVLYVVVHIKSICLPLEKAIG